MEITNSRGNRKDCSCVLHTRIWHHPSLLRLLVKCAGIKEERKQSIVHYLIKYAADLIESYMVIDDAILKYARKLSQRDSNRQLAIFAIKIHLEPADWSDIYLSITRV